MTSRKTLDPEFDKKVVNVDLNPEDHLINTPSWLRGCRHAEPLNPGVYHIEVRLGGFEHGMVVARVAWGRHAKLVLELRDRDIPLRSGPTSDDERQAVRRLSERPGTAIRQKETCEGFLLARGWRPDEAPLDVFDDVLDLLIIGAEYGDWLTEIFEYEPGDDLRDIERLLRQAEREFANLANGATRDVATRALTCAVEARRLFDALKSVREAVDAYDDDTLSDFWNEVGDFVANIPTPKRPNRVP